MNMYNFPFQNNTNFGVGPYERTQNVLNIQPVLPFSLGSKFNIINRTIVPVIHNRLLQRILATQA